MRVEAPAVEEVDVRDRRVHQREQLRVKVAAARVVEGAAGFVEQTVNARIAKALVVRARSAVVRARHGCAAAALAEVALRIRSAERESRLCEEHVEVTALAHAPALPGPGERRVRLEGLPDELLAVLEAEVTESRADFVKACVAIVAESDRLVELAHHEDRAFVGPVEQPPADSSWWLPSSTARTNVVNLHARN